MKKVRILILSLMMTVSIAAAASSSVSLASVQGAPRDTVTVVVDLSTTDAVSAVDITIPLGSYLKYAQNSVVLSSARSNGHVVSASQVGDNLRLLVYSLTLSALNGTNGELLRFDLVLGKEPGVYALTPQVVLSNASGATISSTSTAGSVTILTPKIALSTSEIDFGHIPIRSTYTRYLTISNTGTATLNVTGITFDDAELSCQQTYSIAAGSSQSVTINYAPQTHGAVTAKMTIASDATNGSQKVNIKADPFSVNELHLLNGSGIADDTIEVFMRMNNMENIVGMQSSFKMPESLVFIPNSFSVTPRGADHLAMASMSHDTLTLMAYSPTNTPFTGNDDTLCSFKVRLNGSSGYHYLTPFNVVLANAAGVNMMSATSNGYVYINSPRINVPSQLNMGNVSVTETKRVGLRIDNYSNVDLKVGRVTFLSEGYSIVSQLPMTIQEYSYDTLWVEYHPTVEGNFSTTMQVYSNDPISRMTSVNVYGTAFEPNEFNLKGRRLDDGRYALTVGLDNYSDIVALQMDIHWLAGMNTNSSALTLKTRANGMLPMISQMSNGVYRVAIFSMNNIPLLDHSGEVFQLIYDGESDYNHSNIIIDNLIASDKKGVNKISKENGEFYVDLKEITVSCDNTRGVTSGGGIYNVGDTALLTASAFEDYHFMVWSNDSTSDSLYIVVNEDLSLTARFAHNPYLFQEFDTICQNTDYTWHNRQLSETGVYYDSLKTSEDVDSVYELTLTVNPTYFFPETYSICQGETYTWRSKSLSTAGIYYDSLKTTVDCDSVYELTLTVNPTYFFPETYSICQGETYNWRNKSLSAAGVYYDSLNTTVGCDSVYELTLTVNPTYLFQETYSICQGETYNWRNKSLSAAGVYYDSLQTQASCDSVYELTLTVNPTYFFPETYSICQGETYNWRSKSLSTAGVYYDSLKTTVGCDSVYELTLTVNSTYFFQETYSICQGKTYNWRSKSLSTAGVYYDSLNTTFGCDSVYELTLKVNPTYFFPETHSICQGETYNWRSKSLSTAGVYYDSLKTTIGCDSVYELTLTVNPTYLFQETYSICQGETYNWRNKSLSAAGVYYDSLKTAIGCDSIYKLTLLVNSTYLIQQTVKWPSSKGNYIWRGKTIASAGIYYDSLKTISYCDSVYKLTIQFVDDYLFTEYVSICQGEQYSWRGNDYEEAGIYYDSLRTVDGILDSVYELTLTVNPTYFFPETYSICQGETYNWHNKSLSVAGVYYDSLKTAVDCDSVYELTLTVNPTYLFPETYSICQSETYNWRSKSLSTAGVYYDSLETTVGCDSVYELTLTVNPTYFFPETHSICQGETYTWRNKVLSVAGVYYDSLKTTVGCDSVYELTLTVNPTYLIQETYSICQGETYNWRSKSLSTAGIYYDSLKTTVGCDSVYELTLTVNPTYFFPETYSICQGETYSWHNKSLSVAGVYYDSLQTQASCDSVYELTLTVNPTYFFPETYSICQGETYSWHNKSLSVAGVYYDSLKTTIGCDSVYELTLTINPTYFSTENDVICHGNVYIWHLKTITTAGIYYDTLKTIYGCDSICELTLTVNPTYFFPETYSICQGETYNWHNKSLTNAGVYYDSLKTTVGCDSVYELTLTVNPTYEMMDSAQLTDEGSGYLWHDKWYYEPGVYYDSLKTVDGCDSVIILNLSDYVPSGVDEVSMAIVITLAPNPINGGEISYIYADWTDKEREGMMVEIISTSGQIVKRMKPETFPISIEDIPITGTYLVRIVTGTGNVYIKKLIVM